MGRKCVNVCEGGHKCVCVCAHQDRVSWAARKKRARNPLAGRRTGQLRAWATAARHAAPRHAGGERPAGRPLLAAPTGARPPTTAACPACLHVRAPTCDHTEVRLGLKGVEHLDDVFVLELPQDLDLLAQVPDVLFRLAVLDNELHGRDLAGASPPALVHLLLRRSAVVFVCAWSWWSAGLRGCIVASRSCDAGLQG